MEPRMWNESELKKFANKEEKPMRRQAGVWSFPNTREKVDKLISSLQDLELDKLYKLTDDDNEDPIIQSLFDLAGDDELWDKLESSDKKGSTIYNMIMDWIEKMYKEYEQDPSNFRSKVDPETMAYVKEFMGRRASKKSPLREAMASLKVLAEGEEIDLEDKKIVDDAVDVFFSLVDDQGMDEKEAVLQVSDVLFGQQVDDFLEALEKLGIDLTPKEMRKKIRELRSAAKQEKPEEKKPEPPKKEDKKEEKTPSEKAFDHILKAILPKKDGGEGKSFAEAQKEAMKLYGEEVKQEKFDQMKKEKDKKKGGDSVDKKKASLEIEAQKARLQEKIGGFFDAKPAGPSKEEKLFDGKPKGSDSPANPFTGKEAPGERGKPQDPFKGKEAPGDRGKPEDHFGEQVPGGDKGGNMYKELTAQVQVLQQKEQDLTKELSLAKMRATSMESRASVYKAKYERAMKAYDLVNEMLSKGMIATASAKKTFQDLVDSNEAQITATENLVKVFQPSAGARIAGLRDRRIAGLSREIQADRSQGAIGAPGAAPVGGDGIEIEDIFNT